MRLTPDQVQAIRYAATQAFGEDAGVWLFGSRADDHKKGGDIDLLVHPAAGAMDHVLMRKINMRIQIEQLIGEQKIDIVVEAPFDTRPIVKIAHDTGVRLQ
jgi:predicted nucleotidyltransferase